MTVKFLTPCTFGYNRAMSESLRLWLSQELNQRKWSHNELARQTGFSQAFVSNVLNGERKPSANFCNKVAKALDVAPEMVLRLAGILPPTEPASPTDDATLRELIELSRNLPPDKRQEVLRFVRFLYQQNE